MQEVLSIIREEYHEKLSLSFVANRIHLNANYLSRKFYEEIGIGFADYLNAYRLEMAKKLLVNQRDMSMAVIAEKAGFNSQHYFSAMFKKQFGVTPSEFRINPKRTENQ